MLWKCRDANIMSQSVRFPWLQVSSNINRRTSGGNVETPIMVRDSKKVTSLYVAVTESHCDGVYRIRRTTCKSLVLGVDMGDTILNRYRHPSPSHVDFIDRIHVPSILTKQCPHQYRSEQAFGGWKSLTMKKITGTTQNGESEVNRRIRWF